MPYRIVTLALFSSLVACGGSRTEPRGPAEEAGEAIDEAAEDTETTTEEAAEDVGDAVDDMGEPKETDAQ